MANAENKSRASIVYLPIEFSAREFESKCLLAAVLAEKGYSVLVGQQWMLYANIERLPLGTILFKSFNKAHQKVMNLAKQAGHRVAVLEEELLAQTQEQAVVAMSPGEVFDLPELILANGKFERDILMRLSGGKSRVEITGNGRIDILKPDLQQIFQPEIDAVKAKYGDFVLINTNFSIRNSVWRDVEEVTRIQIQTGFVQPDDPASVKQWQDYLAFEERNMAGMHAAIRELARRRPQQKIIIRPHPGEDLRRWDGLFPDFPNIAVVREGAHMPWTLACQVLLHTSCTTGFEAAVADKTALSLVPLREWIADSILSNHVNPVFATSDELIAEAERILDGLPPSPFAPSLNVGDYVYNWSNESATKRVADLLAEQLAAPNPIEIPALRSVTLDQRSREKFNVSADKFKDTLARIRDAAKLNEKLNVYPAGEGLFFVSKHATAISVSPKFDAQALLTKMKSALKLRQFREVHESFRQNFGKAHRYPDLCFLAGLALAELGDFKLALQYFQQASAASNGVIDPNYAFLLAKAHDKLGDRENAWHYAQLAYHMAPTDSNFFEFYKYLNAQTNRKTPDHWIVIGCSHARYFRYMQMNQSKFFGNSLHLECYEFGGATAYGLGNPNSESGALRVTQQLRQKIVAADRVLINFGEIDCRRAAWKAASLSGKSIEDHIAESATHLGAYIEREILPFNRNVLVIGAKPQIIADSDFYQNSLEDERTIFKPLVERERITLLFNAKLRALAERLHLDYVDIDDVLQSEPSRQSFFENAFWDSYTDDTHGNVDFFAGLYFERLKKFIGKKRGL